MAANVLMRGAETPDRFTRLRPYAVLIAAALPLGEWAAFPFLVRLANAAPQPVGGIRT
jgi:hypothetical protein